MQDKFTKNCFVSVLKMEAKQFFVSIIPSDSFQRIVISTKGQCSHKYPFFKKRISWYWEGVHVYVIW
jgi:hypothetical protein